MDDITMRRLSEIPIPGKNYVLFGTHFKGLNGHKVYLICCTVKIYTACDALIYFLKICVYVCVCVFAYVS